MKIYENFWTYSNGGNNCISMDAAILIVFFLVRSMVIVLDGNS